MDLGLKDRVVVVTGGSRGIGRAAAMMFGNEGARVAITFAREGEKAEAVVVDLRGIGADACAIELELGSLDSIREAASTVLERWGHIDVLVNNAVQWGTTAPWEAPLFEHLTPDEWTSTLRTNIGGAFGMTQAVLPAMRERGWGRIVNVSSAVAVDGLAGAGAYATAKSALHGLTRTLSKELGPAGILVNVVMPGLTLTERNSERISDAAKQQLASQSPIRRLLPPEEVVPTIVFLCSAMNTAVTGEIIRASGGIT